MTQRTLGIVGGIGPPATAKLYLDVCRALRASTGENPRILVSSLAVPVEMEQRHLLGVADPSDWDHLESLIARECEYLTEAGATTLALACNTIGYMVGTRLADRGWTVLTPLASTLARVRVETDPTAIVVSTGWLARTRAYHDGIAHEGAAVVDLPVWAQASLDRLLLDSVGGTQPQAEDVMTVAKAAASTKATHLVVGCTDLSWMSEDPIVTRSIRVVDSLHELMLSCVAEMRDETAEDGR